MDQSIMNGSYDQKVNKLAEQLAALRYEWSDSAYICGNVSPVDSEFSFFSSSFNPKTEMEDLSKSCDLWQKKDDNTELDFYARFTDTPKTWPKSNYEANDDRRYSLDSGFATPYSGSIGGHGAGKLNADPFPMTKQDVVEWLDALRPPVPGPGYICRICHGGDHYVQNCPRAPPRTQMNTPYQGYNQCYGLFECPNCGNEWDSHNSWAEMGQICRGCQRLVYPHKQFPLDKIPPGKLKKRIGGRKGSRC